MIKSLPLILLLVGCSSGKTNYAGPVQECVANQVPAGTKLSAQRAREVVGNCEVQIDRWAYDGLRQMMGSDFDPDNPSVAQEYRDRKEAIEEMLLVRLSDEIQPRTVVM